MPQTDNYQDTNWDIFILDDDWDDFDDEELDDYWYDSEEDEEESGDIKW